MSLDNYILENSEFIQMFKDEDLSELMTERELQLIDLFRQDHMQFSQEVSLEVLDIINKFEFKQASDFALLCIFRFNLISFDPKYYFEHFLDLVRYKRNQREKGENYIHRKVSLEEKLIIACKNGCIMTVEFLMSQEISLYDGLTFAVEHNQLELVKWLENFIDFKNHRNTVYLYNSALKTENLEMVKLVIKKKNIQTFIKSLTCKNFEIVKFFEMEIPENIQQEHLIEAFRFGSLETAKLILNKIPISESARSSLYSAAVSRGNLDVVKWIHSINGFQNREYWSYFPDCLKYGKLESLKWLHEANFFVISDFRELFRGKYLKRPLESIKWMYTFMEFSEEEKLELFTKACLMDNAEVAKWLHSILNINDERLMEIFETICCKNAVNIAKWIYSIIPIYPDQINSIFIKSSQGENRQIVEWLYNIEDINPDLLEQAFMNCIVSGFMDGFIFFYNLFGNNEDIMYKAFLKTCSHYYYFVKFLLYKVSDKHLNLAFRTVSDNPDNYLRSLIYSTRRITDKTVNLTFIDKANDGDLNVLKYLSNLIILDRDTITNCVINLSEIRRIDIRDEILKFRPIDNRIIYERILENHENGNGDLNKCFKMILKQHNILSDLYEFENFKFLNVLIQYGFITKQYILEKACSEGENEILEQLNLDEDMINQGYKIAYEHNMAVPIKFFISTGKVDPEAVEELKNKIKGKKMYNYVFGA